MRKVFLFFLVAVLAPSSIRWRPFSCRAVPGLCAGQAEVPARDTLAAAGDTVLARWEHDLVARHGFQWPLEGVAAILSGADAALCNLECCVALGGLPAPKGERCPFYYRARPEMLGCLTGAGIDIVTAANNHGGDYGPSGVAETLAWTEKAGLVCAGIGRSIEEASLPRLVLVGRTRAAVCGLDTTMPLFAATPERPGSNFAEEKGDLPAFTEKMRELGAWARGRCDLLVLTVHWGDNWVREVTPAQRKMARIAFEHGVDLILGHSAHRLKGIEVMGGKVVLYDMGNLLFDCLLKEEGRRSAIFRLRLSRGGVHRVEIIPIEAREGQAVLASAAEGRAILDEMKLLSAPLGTTLKEERDASGAAMGVLEVPGAKVTPRPPVEGGTEFFAFPRTRNLTVPRSEATLRRGVPDDAVKVDPPHEVAPGVELLGFRLPETAEEKGILEVATWWRVTRAVKENWLLAVELVTAGKVLRRGTPWYTRHDPGDWLLPLSRMRPGEIVEDRYPARLQDLPAGECEVKVLALDPAKPEGEGILGKARVLGRVSIEPSEQ